MEIPGSEFVLPVQLVIPAIGNTPNPLIRTTTPGLEANRKGCLVVEEDTLRTSREGVYAGRRRGDRRRHRHSRHGAGKQAAASIDAYIRQA